MNHTQAWIIRTTLSAAILCLLLCLSMGADKSAGGLPSGLRRVYEVRTPEEQATAMRQLQVDSYMADISLEVREVDDFLLTPALLVQEAVSEGVVLTYPEE